MRLVHILNGWCFLFGSKRATAQILALDGEDRFFRSRAEAIAAAKRRGLMVAKNGTVTATPGNSLYPRNATAGASRAKPVGYRCRGCGTVFKRKPGTCIVCSRRGAKGGRR